MSSTGHLSELDLLRSQVADLSRELAERDCVTQDLREQSDLLRAIVEGTAAETGEEFFASLVTHLTAALHIQFAVIGEVQGDRIKKMRTLAVSAGGVLVDNFEYDLPHTPCATALTQAFTCFNQDLQATFPGFQRLVDLGAESYCAVPIRTKDGEVRGLLVVMDTKPLQHGEDLQSLLEVFAPRAGAEFERRRVEQEHARALAEIHNVIKTIPDIMFTLDTHGNMVNWNRRVEDVTGYSPEELLNMPALAFVPPEEHIPCATAIERAFTEGYAEFEGHLVTKDHRLIPYHWTGALLKNSYGEPIGITGIGRDVSGKKRVEEALRKSEHRFALAVEGSSDILWDATRLSGEPWYAPQTQIWWSPRVRELLGLQESDSFETFEQWVARLHPDDKDRVFGQLAAHIEHRVPYDVEYRLRTNAGDYRWIRGRGQALWDEQGEPSRMSGSCQDITERKEVEEALRASEERWQLAVRGSNDGIWDWDIPSGTVFFSPRWKAMRGFGEYEITSHVEKWQSRIHPDDLDRVLQNLNAYMSKQTPVFCEEYRTQRKDGSYMWILDRGLALWAEGGTPVRMVGSESDITEHKLAEDALREREQALARFKATLDQTHDCVFMFAPDTLRFIYCNSGAVEQVGYSEAELFTMTPLDLKPEFTERNFREMLQPLQDGRMISRVFETIHRHKDGHNVPVEVSLQLVREQGQEGRFVAIVRNVTERKQAEESLRASEEKFQSLVDNIPGAVYRCAADEHWTMAYLSNAIEDLIGYPSSDFINNQVRSYVSVIHPDDRRLVGVCVQAGLDKNEPYQLEYRLLHCDGTIRWVYERGRGVSSSDGALRYCDGAIFDITERKRAEQLLEVERQVLASMAIAQPLTDTLTLLCKGCESISQGMLVSVLLLDQDGQHLRHGAAPSLPDAYSRAIDGLPIGPLVGSCGPAVYFGRQMIVTDIATDPLWEQYRELACSHDLRSCWSTPIASKDGRVLGTFAAYYRTTREPLQADLHLINRMNSLACLTIERTQADQLLKTSEERLRQSLLASNTGLWDWNTETGEVIFSKEWKSQLGYLETELPDTFESWESRLHPDDRVRAVAYARHYVDNPAGTFRQDFRLLHKDGTYRWIDSQASLVTESDGRRVRLVGSHTDITERKQTEEALRASEDRFNLAVRGSNTGIWDWDLRTGKTYFSPLWKSMLGYGEHELRGELFEWEERLHPDDRKRSSATVRAYLEGATAQYELEHRLRHKDGSYRWIMARGVSICDTEGKPYRMAGSHIDITEQKQTQEALAQRERQLQTVLDALPVGVWFTDRAGRVLLANPAAKQIWSNIKQIGLQTENPQTGWWESIGPVNEPHRWALSHVLTTGVPSQDETFDFECFDGTKKTIRNSTVPVKNEAGVTLGAILLNEDITMLRQAQAALQLTQFSVDHALEGFLWIGPDARIFHVNDSICRMLEYSWEELTTMTQYDIDPNLSSEAWPAHWEKLKEKGSLTFESKYWSRTGRVLDMEVTVNYLQYEGKEYNCAIMRDIGERKRVQAALRVSEERYRSLYDETPTMYFTLTMDGMVLSVNRFGAEQLGYQAEELIGHSVLGLFYEDDQEIVAASLSECLATPEITRHWEFRKLRKDGSMLWVRETTRVGQSSTEGTTVQVTCEDITERKRAEEALHRREHDLHVAIEERERISQDLHDGILQSLFAVGLSLETTKSMMSPRTRKTSGPALDQAIQQLNLVMHEIRNFIAGLASDLLQGKDLTMALKQMLASLTENQSTNVRLAVDDRAAKALSTEQSLHLVRVIQEAVSNCIQHGNASEARVSLKLLKKGVRLSVRDNGCGFIQTSAQRTGHGLRNMASRAQKIGGKFSILSKVNEGTSIVLDLPKGATDAFR